MRTLRSDVTKRGITRTPHRAFMRAMGLDDAAIEKPMVGIVSMKGEQTPCNMTHGFQVEAAKEGVAESGGTPREFTTISVSDGISMNHEGMKFSLVSRELIADSIEAVVNNIRTWLVALLTAVATLFLTIGGLRLMWANGDPGEAEKGKAALRSAAIGYALALLSPLIVTVVAGWVK